MPFLFRSMNHNQDPVLMDWMSLVVSLIQSIISHSNASISISIAICFNLHLQFFDPTFGKSSVDWTKFLWNGRKCSFTKIEEEISSQSNRLNIFTGFVAVTNFWPVTVIWKFHYLAALEILAHLTMYHLRFALCLYWFLFHFHWKCVLLLRLRPHLDRLKTKR